VSWLNQHNAFATSMEEDQPVHLIRIHAVCLPPLLQVGKLIANNMGPDQTAQRRRLVWIHADRKPIMLVLSRCFHCLHGCFHSIRTKPWSLWPTIREADFMGFTRLSAVVITESFCATLVLEPYWTGLWKCLCIR
jgi:hypothetical protein